MDISSAPASTPNLDFRFLRSEFVVKFCVPKVSLSDREKEICRRVREAREFRGITQSECAEKTGIRRSTLANYESLITPLGYDEAKRLCYRLDINQRWLAKGNLPRVPYFDLSPNLEFSIKPNSLFSKAFDDVISPKVEERCSILIDLVGLKDFLAGNYDNAVLDTLHPIGEDPAEASTFYVSKILQVRLHSMPSKFKSSFAAALLAAEEKFQKEHGSEIEQLIHERQKRDAANQGQSETEKSGLTNVSLSGNNLDVKAQLPALLKRLNEATRERGTKTALAKFMDVKLPNVSQWLSGEKEPGGENTLRLLHWVEQQERQK